MLAAFRDGKLRTLIATDIAARGIDVDGVSHVVNYDLPNIPESYVHRIGRTARAGAAGVAISFCDHEEAPFLRDIERLIRMAIPSTDRRTGQTARPSAGRATCRQPQWRQAASQGRQQRGQGNGLAAAMAAATAVTTAITATARSPRQWPSGPQSPAGRPFTGPPARSRAGEPNGIGNVTFLQRPNGPRRNAGHRAQR